MGADETNEYFDRTQYVYLLCNKCKTMLYDVLMSHPTIFNNLRRAKVYCTLYLTADIMQLLLDKVDGQCSWPVGMVTDFL
jgi:hypothetical protein